MLKKPVFLLLGCFTCGLLLGIVGMYVVLTARGGKAVADTVVTMEFVKIGEASQRASAAYRHESKPVAIYALSQYLLALQKAEEVPGYTSFMPPNTIRPDMMLTHARLAKLYAETSQPDLSTQHVAQALACAKTAGHWSEITNWATLADVVARIDRNARD